ncbi:hypothetical protein EON65_28865 [archaeon]|nr:MAG: hypothetical protein EON65_28865 [archaeon]
MDYNEYAANMDLGVVYLEVMERVVKEGFDFIAPELERWQDVGQALILKSAKLTRLEDKDDRELIDEASMGILGIVWELDPESGKKKEYSVELDGNYFDAFSLHERNRLLVLSAFDIAAHLEPAEHFDLSLGFSLGILDNDRSRQREQEQLELEGPDGGSLKSKKKRSKQPQGKLDKVVSAALFEEQTSPAIGISSSFRSSVPTLSLENDWSFHIFLFFLFLTFAIVVASHLSASKKKTRIRTRPAKRTSPYEQLIYALCRPVAALFSVADPNDENDETVPEALSNIIKSWQVQATAEWILGGMRKTLLVEFPQFLWTKGFAMLAGDGKGSKKVAEKDKSKPSKDTVTSSISSLASPFEDLDVAKKTAPEPVSLQSTVASDLRKAKVPKPSDLVEEREKSGKGKTVIFADQLEDDHSHNATNKAHTTASSISPKSALAKSFRSAFAVEEAGAMQEERVTEQKADRNVSDTSNKQQKKVENTYSRKNGQNLNATTSTNTAHSHSFPHQSAAGTSVATQEDLGWYDWQEVSKPKADEGWTEAKRKPTHKQKENKKGAQPSAVAVPFQKSAPAPALSVVAAPTNPNPQGTGAQKTSISVKKAYVKAPVGVEGAKRPVGFEELLAKQTMSLNLEDHIAKPTLGKPVSNSAAPSSPSLDSMHAPGLYPSDSIAKGITYKNVVANEVSPSLLPPTADETDSMSSWMSQTFLGNSIFASTTSNNNMLSGLHESTADDSSSLFYRLGLAAYSGDTVRTGAPTISTLSAPPGLERKVHQMPTAGMYNHSTVNGLSSHYNMNMSLRSQRDMEQDMEQDMESQNLLQGILGDILHPSSPILEQNAQHKMSALNSSTGLFGTSTYNHSPTMSFLYSNSMSNAGRDTEQSNLSAQSDLSPLAPVFDPTKGLVLQEEDAIDTTSSLWDWNHE